MRLIVVGIRVSVFVWIWDSSNRLSMSILSWLIFWRICCREVFGLVVMLFLLYMSF